MKKFNDRLERVQIGRDKDVPIEINNQLWLLWIDNEHNWDADTVSNWKSYISELESEDTYLIFCVWHGNYRTNLFLMNKKKLIKRLKCLRNI